MVKREKFNNNIILSLMHFCLIFPFAMQFYIENFLVLKITWL